LHGSFMLWVFSNKRLFNKNQSCASNRLATRTQLTLTPEIVNRYRAGDIRHCFSELSRIRTEVGYQPQVSLEQGIGDLIPWIQSQQSSDRVRTAVSDLEHRVLMH